MISLINIVAGIGWEPEIRGILTVALSLAILGGSVWLLLVTNTGTRLGSLLALAGFWGWMFVMGIFWWIYGIGWVGASPSWEVQDVFIDQPGAEVAGIGDAFVGNVGDLPDTNCFDGTNSFPPDGGVATVSVSAETVALCTPRAIDLLMAYPGPEREIAIRELLNPQTEESKIENIVTSMGASTVLQPGVFPEKVDNLATLAALSETQRDQVFDTVVEMRYAEITDNLSVANDALGPDDPRYKVGEELAARIKVATEAQDIRTDDLSLSALRAAAPAVIDWAQDQGFLDLDGWQLQTASQSGEAAATADAYLRDKLFSEGNFVVLDAFQQGGKEKRDGSGMLTRIGYKITSTAQIKHPTNYTVVNVQQILDKTPDPALPPPVPEADPAEPTYSVVMVRNLGNLRLIPALFTLASLALFLVTCWVLHIRDLKLRSLGLDV